MGRAAIKDHENLLKVFVILLEYGAIKRSTINSWADSILASEDESEYEFIELSTATNGHDTTQILKKNSAEADPEITYRAVLGILYHMLQDGKVILKTVFEIATFISYEKSLTSDEQFLLYRFDEHVELNLNDVYETSQLFKTNFLDLLSIYKNFTLNNHNKWPDINENTKQNLNIRLEAVKKNYPY
ncbi:hypothetical protein SAMN05421866_3340 [Chryseobacterium oranimense]|uniref:Uncharacterized protein n=1 Tax=Chryseobacterium oranimense TaxID=421058 RepID=A0A1M5UQQ9_9FLAO|nr:hypothetical protein [Chryseobacterium oranimense]SHH65309.1 hypothetical protein SAMN05421866_3340 [Chryseobacterium oranimense]